MSICATHLASNCFICILQDANDFYPNLLNPNYDVILDTSLPVATGQIFAHVQECKCVEKHDILCTSIDDQ